MENKKVRDYHIESYWAEEAAKRERACALKQKFREGFWIGVFCILNIGIGIELLRQLFDVL